MGAGVVAIERDLRAGQMLQRALQERLRHVLAELLDLTGLAAVGLQKQRERLHRLMIAALHDEHAAALIQVREHAEVLMPTPRAGLIDPHPLHAGEVLRVDGLIDVVMHHPPHPRVVLAEQPASALTGISLTIATISASNNSVNPDRGLAHDSATCRTLRSGHATRGTRAVRYVWCWQKSMCRHVFSAVS
jgi:hypothetical protein